MFPFPSTSASWGDIEEQFQWVFDLLGNNRARAVCETSGFPHSLFPLASRVDLLPIVFAAKASLKDTFNLSMNYLVEQLKMKELMNKRARMNIVFAS